MNHLRIAITGHQGFIGSCLIEKLKEMKITPICIEGDVQDRKIWNQSFDVLYHLAAVVPQSFVKDPVESFSVNVMGTLQALEACKRNKAHMIFPSTCGVYKPHTKIRYVESDEVAPPTPYAKSKLMAEDLCQFYAAQYGVKSTVLRLFNVYGPGQRSEFIVPYLCECALKGTKAHVKHPDSRRDFIHINDVLDAFVCVIKKEENGFDLFNVGSGQSYAIRELIDMIGRVGEHPLSLIKTEAPADYQPSICADIEKIQKKFQWSPRYDLKKGIEEILQLELNKMGDRHA